MVKVPGPEDIPQVSPQRLRAPSVRVSADDFGAGVAEEAARLGVGLAEKAVSLGHSALQKVLGGVADGLRERRQGAEDGAFVSAAVAEGRDRMSSLFDELEGLATDGPEDLATAFQRRAAEETETLVADLRQRGQRPSRSGLSEAMRQLQGLQADFGVEAAVFENNARVGRLSRGLDDTLAAAEARAFSHPEQLRGLLADAERAAARLAPHLPADAVTEFKNRAPERLATAALSGLMALDPAGARDSLAAGDFDDLLGDDMKQALGRQAAAEAEGAEARRKAREALDKEDARRDLAGAIAAGAKGFPDIARAVQDDLVDADEATRLEEHLEARFEADRRVAGVLAGEATLNLDDIAQRRALDRYYRDAFMPSLQGVAEEQALPRLMAFVGRAGAAPDALIKKLRAGVLSGEPGLQAVTAAPVAALDALGPGFVAAIPLDEQARAHAIAGFSALGLAPARAAELGNGLIDSKRRVPAAVPSLEAFDLLERPGDEDPDGDRPRPVPLLLTGEDGHDPDGPGGRLTREIRIDDPPPQRMTMELRPGFVWEDGEWRRETPDDVRNKFHLLSGEVGGDSGDGTGPVGDSGGGDGDASGDPGRNGGPDGGGGDGADTGGGQKPGMVGPGGEGKPDEKPSQPSTGTEPDKKPDDSEIPDFAKPIVDYLKENPSPHDGDTPGWIEDFFGVISGVVDDIRGEEKFEGPVIGGPRK